MVVVIHGPMACGKTHNRHALAKAYNCEHIHDGEAPTAAAIRQAGGSHLVLVTPDRVDELKDRYMRAPGGVRLVPYATAAKRAGVK